MKRFIVIGLVLLFAVPAMASYRADRADLLASAGLFNVAALDNPDYEKQAKEMETETSRGRVSIQGRMNIDRGQDVNLSYNGNISHDMLSQYKFSGTAKDADVDIYTFYYNNGTLTSTNVMDRGHGNNRPTTYSGTTGIRVYYSRRP